MGGATQTNPPGSGASLFERMELLLSVRTDEAQSQMQQLGTSLKNVGATTAEASSAMEQGFKSVAKAAGLIGISFNPLDWIKGVINMQQELKSLERHMYEAAMTATRGGAATMEWTNTHNEQVKQSFYDVVAFAQMRLRMTSDEVSKVFDAVAISGVGALTGVARSVDDVKASMDSLAEATRMALVLDKLGFSPQQITSLYHSMAVNLRMDTESINDALHRFLILSEDTKLAWSEQISIVTRTLEQYSKFGVTLDDVTLNLKSITDSGNETNRAFQNLGATYDILMARMRAREATTPEQLVKAFTLVTPEEMGQVFMGTLQKGTEEYKAQLAKINEVLKRTGLAKDLGFTEQEITAGRPAEAVVGKEIKPLDFPAVYYALQNFMSLGALAGFAGERLTPTVGRGELGVPWIAQVLRTELGPMFEEAWVRMRTGQPDAIREMKDSSLMAIGGTTEAIKQVQDKLGDLKDAPMDSKTFYRFAGEKLHRVEDATTGIAQDVKFFKDFFTRTLFRREYGEYLGGVGPEGKAAAVKSELFTPLAAGEITPQAAENIAKTYGLAPLVKALGGLTEGGQPSGSLGAETAQLIRGKLYMETHPSAGHVPSEYATPRGVSMFEVDRNALASFAGAMMQNPQFLQRFAENIPAREFAVFQALPEMKGKGISPQEVLDIIEKKPVRYGGLSAAEQELQTKVLAVEETINKAREVGKTIEAGKTEIKKEEKPVSLGLPEPGGMLGAPGNEGMLSVNVYIGEEKLTGSTIVTNDRLNSVLRDLYGKAT